MSQNLEYFKAEQGPKQTFVSPAATFKAYVFSQVLLLHDAFLVSILAADGLVVQKCAAQRITSHLKLTLGLSASAHRRGLSV